MDTSRLPDRFWKKVRKDRKTGCWNWIASMYPTGYGAFNPTGYAHRYAYMMVRGALIKGMTIDHLCRNRACCNPAHLEQVSQRENLMRGPTTMAAIRAAKTHCPQGHPYRGHNLLMRPGKGRSPARACRTCWNLKQKKWYWQRKQRTDAD